MKKLTLVATIVLAVLASVAAWQSAFGGAGHAAGGPRVASVIGVAEVQGERVFVDITVLVPPGVDERAATDAALSAQAARRATALDLQAAPFTTSGLVWDQFSDGPGNDFVTQYYNAANEPAGVDGETALTNTHATWSSVTTSSFAFSGGTTSRCPSLVDECSGPQLFDGFNDVAFLSVKGPCNGVLGCTLGVTWSSSSVDEADMALNTKASWNEGCENVAGKVDLETVMLHENGHVVGLGHSADPDAVMYANYGGFRCTLSGDEINGISALYPAGGGPPLATPTSTPSATPTPTPTPTPGGPTATPTSTPFCPPGQHKRGIC